MPKELVIFDCDGVLVDSERITNQVFAEMLNDLGAQLTLADMFDNFVGRSMKSCVEIIERDFGIEVPADFVVEYRTRSREVLAKQVTAIEGVEEALDAIRLPQCVASSGDHHKMETTLGATGLLPRFEGRLFSATEVAQGKPAPDVFLLAAKRMGFAPDQCVVVEDSAIGVQAGVSAGMEVLGFARDTPAERLSNAGAVVFTSMDELPALVKSLT